MQRQPRSLVDLCLRGITDIDQLKELARFEAIHKRMLRMFDEKKQIAIFGKYQRDFIRLYGTGITRSITQYVDGEKCYVCRYYTNGTINRIEHWSHGKLHGRYIHWDINGIVDVHVMYVDGKLAR